MSSRAHTPIRTCVGCRQRDDQRALVRVVRSDSWFRLDPRRRLPGRGAYAHPQCLARAIERGGISRGLRTRVSLEAADDLRHQLSELSQSKDNAKDLQASQGSNVRE